MSALPPQLCKPGKGARPPSKQCCCCLLLDEHSLWCMQAPSSRRHSATVPQPQRSRGKGSHLVPETWVLQAQPAEAAADSDGSSADTTSTSRGGHESKPEAYVSPWGQPLHRPLCEVQPALLLLTRHPQQGADVACAAVQAAGLTHIGSASKLKQNQDCYFSQPHSFGPQQEGSLFGMFDGHGAHGRGIAKHCSTLLPLFAKFALEVRCGAALLHHT